MSSRSTDLPIYDVFVDESSQTKHDYLLLGGIIIPSVNTPRLEEKIAELKQQYRISKEMKWTRVSRYHLGAYKALVDIFFDAPSHVGPFEFHSLAIEMAKRNEAAFNSGSKETGFNKEVYQIIQKFRRLHRNVNFHVYLDYRDSSQPISETRTILNFGARKHNDARDWPFRRLHMRDSKATLSLQLVDILLGAVAYKLNGHYDAPSASPHKKALCDHVLSRGNIKTVRFDTAIKGKFTLWHRRLR